MASSTEPDDGLCFEIQKLRDLSLELSFHGDTAAEEGFFHSTPHLDILLFEIIPKLVPFLESCFCMRPDQQDRGYGGDHIYVLQHISAK